MFWVWGAHGVVPFCGWLRGRYPRGSKYPIFKAFGPRIHTLNSFWEQSPLIFGTWTLWVCLAWVLNAVYTQPLPLKGTSCSCKSHTVANKSKEAIETDWGTYCCWLPDLVLLKKIDLLISWWLKNRGKEGCTSGIMASVDSVDASP